MKNFGRARTAEVCLDATGLTSELQTQRGHQQCDICLVHSGFNGLGFEIGRSESHLAIRVAENAEGDRHGRSMAQKKKKESPIMKSDSILTKESQ